MLNNHLLKPTLYEYDQNLGLILSFKFEKRRY